MRANQTLLNSANEPAGDTGKDRNACAPANNEARPTPVPLFPLGAIVATRPALAAIDFNAGALRELLRRHQCGDWAELDEEDAQSNREAVANGARVFSSFTLGATKYWVITEADRSSTCVLLPSCY